MNSESLLVGKAFGTATYSTESFFMHADFVWIVEVRNLEYLTVYNTVSGLTVLEQSYLLQKIDNPVEQTALIYLQAEYAFYFLIFNRNRKFEIKIIFEFRPPDAIKVEWTLHIYLRYTFISYQILIKQGCTFFL